MIDMGEHLEGYQLGGGRGQMWGKVQGLRTTNCLVQYRPGDVKHSIGNGKAKEPICMTQGHELRRVLLEGMVVPMEGGKGGKLEKI